MSLGDLRADVERWSAEGAAAEDPDAARDAVARLLDALTRGLVRAAERTDDGWRAVEWVKSGILLAFRVGRTERFGDEDDVLQFFDRDTLPLRPTRGVEENIGAWVDEGTMVDSHALVGSCAQVGKRVHLSAGAQLGGVLEPVGLRPVIIEDDVLMGGNTGVFEGTLVGRRAVIAPGVNLTSSTRVYDLVREEIYSATSDDPLTVPEGAVVVPGTRTTSGAFAEEHGLGLYAPVIVKYRDEKTDAATALENALR